MADGVLEEAASDEDDDNNNADAAWEALEAAEDNDAALEALEAFVGEDEDNIRVPPKKERGVLKLTLTCNMIPPVPPHPGLVRRKVLRR